MHVHVRSSCVVAQITSSSSGLEVRTLSLTLTFFIWVHITMSVDSVEKSISSHWYSNSNSLLTCIQNRYYATVPKLCQTNFVNTSSADQERWYIATQSASNTDKNLHRTYDIYCCVCLVLNVIYALINNNEQF